MRSAEPRALVETFSRLDALPDDAAALFDAATNFFATRAWWETVLAHALPSHAVPRLLLIRLDGVASGIFPMLQDREGGSFRALTTPYTCLYEPLIAPDCGNRAAVFAAFARYCRAFPTVRMDALEAAVETLAPETLAHETGPPEIGTHEIGTTEIGITRGAKQSGLTVARFDHFGNWHENVAGLDWAAWLARRPGALRETIRRRTRRAERLTDAAFRLFRTPAEMADGITAFETVYARSWKEPEPFPAVNPAQIRAATGLGLARVGVWWIDGSPAAAQFWIVEHGKAMVLKLAHDEAFKAHSPGTVLTAWIIRDMIEREHATAIDFGRGDDPYKQGWVTERRQRIGLLLINPLRPRGMAALARHAIGRLKARLRHTG